jgi:hypothetical protein
MDKKLASLMPLAAGWKSTPPSVDFFRSRVPFEPSRRNWEATYSV